MRMTDAHSARVTHPRATLKAVLTISRPLFSLPHLLAAGQTILFLSHHREFTKHYEESTSNLWAIGV